MNKKYVLFGIITVLVVMLGVSTAFAQSAASCAGDGEPYIKIISPNGGQVYKPGQRIKVAWKACNLPRNIKVYATTTTPAEWIQESVVGTDIARDDVVKNLGASRKQKAFYRLPSRDELGFDTADGGQSGQWYKIQISATIPTTENASGYRVLMDQSDARFTIK